MEFSLTKFRSFQLYFHPLSSHSGRDLNRSFPLNWVDLFCKKRKSIWKSIKPMLMMMMIDDCSDKIDNTVKYISNNAFNEFEWIRGFDNQRCSLKQPDDEQKKITHRRMKREREREYQWRSECRGQINKHYCIEIISMIKWKQQTNITQKGLWIWHNHSNSDSESGSSSSSNNKSIKIWTGDPVKNKTEWCWIEIKTLSLSFSVIIAHIWYYFMRLCVCVCDIL